MTIEEAIHEFDDAIVETAHNGSKVGDYDHVVISADVAAVLQRWIHDVRKRGHYPENDRRSHHETCWRDHHECAIRRVEELEEFASRLWDASEDQCKQQSECDDEEYGPWARQLLEDAIRLGFEEGGDAE